MQQGLTGIKPNNVYEIKEKGLYKSPFSLPFVKKGKQSGEALGRSGCCGISGCK
jgi:hypothetical protein